MFEFLFFWPLERWCGFSMSIRATCSANDPGGFSVLCDPVLVDANIHRLQPSAHRFDIIVKFFMAGMVFLHAILTRTSLKYFESNLKSVLKVS
jgi:hypothetical protein